MKIIHEILYIGHIELNAVISVDVESDEIDIKLFDRNGDSATFDDDIRDSLIDDEKLLAWAWARYNERFL